MFTIVNQLSVPDEGRPEFEARFGANLEKYAAGTPGLRQASLLRPVTPGDPYLAIIEFDDETAFRAFRTSGGFTSAHQSPDRPRATQTMLGAYRTVATLDGAAPTAATR